MPTSIKPRSPVSTAAGPHYRLLPIVLSILGMLLFTQISAASGSRWTIGQAQAQLAARYIQPAQNGDHGYKVKTAICKGVFKPVAHRWRKFHCTAKLVGWGEYADAYHATKKLTIMSTGRILSGWR